MGYRKKFWTLCGLMEGHFLSCRWNRSSNIVVNPERLPLTATEVSCSPTNTSFSTGETSMIFTLYPRPGPTDPPSFRESVAQYSDEMKLLAERILELGLPSTHIKEAIGEPRQNIVVNYYPACPQPDLTLGIQAHSDYGAQADIAGLQVKKKDGSWIAVEPVEDALVVNLGDMTEVMSNGRYKSVEHRAVVNGGRDRISVATFMDPSFDSTLSPAKELVDDKHPLLYKDITFGEFISNWYSDGNSPEGKRNIDNLILSS